jgi:hypothetical protein
LVKVYHGHAHKVKSSFALDYSKGLWEGWAMAYPKHARCHIHGANGCEVNIEERRRQLEPRTTKRMRRLQDKRAIEEQIDHDENEES